MRIRSALLCVALMAFAESTSAQYVLHRFEGTGPFDHLQACTTVGDLDGDGVTELALGAPNANSGSGRYWVVSGATFDTILGPVDAPSSEQGWGRFLLGIGDFDGDGVPDIAHGDPLAYAPNYHDGAVRILSGVDLAQIAWIPNPFFPATGDLFGATMWRAGDMDGDGRSEFFAGDVSNFPIAHIVDWPIGPLTGYGYYCRTLRNVGDVDGDGITDHLAGYTSLVQFNDFTSPGYLEVHSGATGEVLMRVGGDPNLAPPSNPNAPVQQAFGGKATGVGDIDGDGVPDFAGAATMSGSPVCSGSGWGPGFLRIYSGADAHLIRQVDQVRDSSLWGCQFTHLEGGRDVNGDGVPDILATFPGTHVPGDYGIISGHTRIYSGRTGTMLCIVHPGAKWQGQGLLPDLSGDGIGDFYNGHPWTKDPTGTTTLYHGQIVLYEGFPGDAERICTQPPNSSGQPATLTLDGPINLGVNVLDLLVEGGPPNEFGWYFYGPSEIALPVGDGILCAGPGNVGLQRIGGPVQLDGAGSQLLDLDNTRFPTGSGPADWSAGETWILQFGFRDAASAAQGGAGFGFSDAQRVTWWP